MMGNIAHFFYEETNLPAKILQDTNHKEMTEDSQEVLRREQVKMKHDDKGFHNVGRPAEGPSSNRMTSL